MEYISFFDINGWFTIVDWCKRQESGDGASRWWHGRAGAYLRLWFCKLNREPNREFWTSVRRIALFGHSVAVLYRPIGLFFCSGSGSGTSHGDGFKHESRANSRSRCFEILGCLLLCASAWMFTIGHRHHTQLSGNTKLNTFNHQEHRSYTHVEIYDGEFISDILQGAKHLPSNLSHLQIRFRPGTLALSSAQTLHYCHVDMNIYQSLMWTS